MKVLRSKEKSLIEKQKETFLPIGLKWAELSGRTINNSSIVGRKAGEDSDKATPTLSYSEIIEDEGFYSIPHPEYLLSKGISEDCVNELILAVDSDLEIFEY